MPNDIAVINLAGYFVRGSRRYESNNQWFRQHSSWWTNLKRFAKIPHEDRVSQQECSDYYTKTFRKSIISSQICAKQSRGHGICQGDSGGPLIQGNTIIRVVSGGNGVCGSGEPDVYTKVSHFITYINYELNYDRKKAETTSSPALAVNIESTAPVQPQYPTYPQYPGGSTGKKYSIHIDPNAGALMPPGSEVLVDPTTGVPVVPVTPHFPQIPLYPLYPLYTLYPSTGFVQNQYYNSPSSDQDSS